MYNNIQALRGIAAFLVVLFHMLPQFKAMDLSNSSYEAIAGYGYSGVDIFFVISGFVMAKTTCKLANNSNTAKIFITKRLLRIFLGYWPILLFTVIIYLLVIPEVLAKKDIFASVFLISTNMQELVIGPSWSLTYELYFYFLLALLMVSKIINKNIFFSIIVIFVIGNIIINDKQYLYINFFLSHFLLEFIAGYYLFSAKKLLSHKAMIPVLCISALLAIFCGINIPIADDWTRVATFGVFGVCMVALLINLEDNNIFIINGFLKKLGDASYSLYIIHIVFVNMFYHSGLRNHLIHSHYPAFGFIAYLVFIVLISLIVYKYIEQPLYKKTTKKLTKFIQP